MILIKKKIYFIFVFILLILIILGINYRKEIIKESNGSKMKIIINNQAFEVNLENNETAKKLSELLPLNIKMTSLNDNEKYYYLNESLPQMPIKVKHINRGDLMLYGDNCLVLFYKSFDTNYSYTKIGHIENLTELNDDAIDVIINKG